MSVLTFSFPIHAVTLLQQHIYKADMCSASQSEEINTHTHGWKHEVTQQRSFFKMAQIFEAGGTTEWMSRQDTACVYVVQTPKCSLRYSPRSKVRPAGGCWADDGADLTCSEQPQQQRELWDGGSFHRSTLGLGHT